MPLTYPFLLRLLRPAAERVTKYAADDGSQDLVEVWRARDGRELMVEVIGAGECCRLYRHVSLTTAADVRRELMTR
jgi:hypothetical protein